MRRLVLAIVVSLGAGALAPAAAPRPGDAGQPPGAPAENALVARYCASCHSDRAKAGGLSLASFDLTRVEHEAEVAEKMIRKLRAGMMPPAGAPRPDAAALASLAATLEATMDARWAANPNPGWRPVARLNRAEYAREIRRLLAIDVDVTALLPADTVSDGFDNIADTQTFSPTLMEGYLRAAGRVTALALGDVDASASQATYKVSKMTSQLARVEGAPFGTRGGVSVEHTFPADGDYVLSADLYAEPLGLLFGSTSKGEQLEISIDGARVALLDIDPKMSEEKTGLQVAAAPVHVTAGPHRVTAAFLSRFDGLVNDLVAPIDHTLADTEIGIAYGITTLPHLRALNIVGPHRVTGVSDTVSRRAVFTCRPTSAAEEAACAAEIVRGLATRAYRRPVEDREFESLMAFYERGRGERNFEHGVAKSLEAVLASPQFLLRVEEHAPAGEATRRLSGVELASRLSFFLWGQGPDEALRRAAVEGRLGTPDGLSAQTRRLLDDPRSDALATRFAAQWLRLQDLERVFPDPILYPYYDQTLADGFRRETELFFDSLVREDRSVLELLTADWSFVNERVARHYGVPDVTGQAFRRVALPEERRGILGHGSVLTLTSIADRTSPVMRGKWVLEVLLGSPPPPPPPNVPALEETTGTDGSRVLSVRERLEEHRRNPACSSCHRVIDPLGLALERFDATGRARRNDGGLAVDAAGVLYDGSAIDGATGLRDALLARQDTVLAAFTESLMTYALGRRLTADDMPAVRQIVRRAAGQGYRTRAFVEGVVDTAAFQSRRMPALERTDRTAAAR